ncbi:MAG: hypothetical protein AAF533_16080 [Acidobacteriota bacterium]
MTTKTLTGLVLFSLVASSALAQGRGRASTGYDSQGRRDPFRPTIGQDKEEDTDCGSFEGLRSVMVQEVKLTSIVSTPDGNVATFEGGPYNLGYFTRVGDRFCDGTVHEINFETKAVTVQQKRNDPTRERFLKPYTERIIQLFPDEEKDKTPGAAPARGRTQVQTPSRRVGRATEAVGRRR